MSRLAHALELYAQTHGDEQEKKKRGLVLEDYIFFGH